MDLLKAIHEQVIEERQKIMKPQDLSIGEYVMRRRSSDKDPEWILTRINETYLELIKQFPEDYRMPTPEELLPPQ